MTGPMDMLPIHFACMQNSVDIVEYPDAIVHATAEGMYPGMYPIHLAITFSRVDSRYC